MARAREGFVASLALVPSVFVYDTALAPPLILAPGGRLAARATEPELWGAVVVFVLAALRVNLLVAVSVSVVVVALLRAVV